MVLDRDNNTYQHDKAIIFSIPGRLKCCFDEEPWLTPRFFCAENLSTINLCHNNGIKAKDRKENILWVG